MLRRRRYSRWRLRRIVETISLRSLSFASAAGVGTFRSDQMPSVNARKTSDIFRGFGRRVGEQLLLLQAIQGAGGLLRH